jgi:tRNA dimethylallyltransferase
MPKILIILGPTASGKSALAVELATRFNGEVISADSRQVYRGLDIATGKITETEMDGIPHHLLDVADPKDAFSASEYEVRAHAAIDDILARGKLPIICGGTGFYIDTVMNRISIPDVAPDRALRKMLAEKSVMELHEMLRELDPVRADNIEQQNPVRLIRAIEIAKVLGAVPPIIEKEAPYDALWIGLSWPKELLVERVRARVASRLADGMIEEARNLHSTGLSYGRMEELGLEYSFLASYLRDELTEEELAAAIEQGNMQYAKRQMTYWKRNNTIEWFDQAPMDTIIERVSGFLGSAFATQSQ